ncbi:MAG TPA: type II toxin-antitoxin system YafQ family toxin [Hanamia sp.]|nr:type II toxin-antitoxin system YafQ family toxin [Hanamia sp.]
MIRTIKRTTKFKRDYKREKKSGRHKTLDKDLISIVESLAEDKPLAYHNYDHPLSGNWTDHRDCHIKPDLILIYRKPDDKSLELVRLGSHSELGLA